MRATLRLGSSRSTPKYRFGRSNPVTVSKGSRSPSSRTMSRRTRSVAVAVSAATAGALRQLRYEVADSQIRRTEVLPPLRHAVGLVHCHERDDGLAGEVQKARVGQALGRHVHDLVGPRERTAQHGGLLPGRERGVEVGAAHARVQKRAHLVAHERHQRAHHQREALKHDARHLVAHRLAGARGHDRQRVAARKQRVHHFPLPRAKRVVPETLLERPARQLSPVHESVFPRHSPRPTLRPCPHGRAARRACTAWAHLSRRARAPRGRTGTALFPRPPSYRIARGTGAGWAGAAAVARVGMGTRRAEWPGRGARGTQTKAGNERGAPQGAGREDGRRDASRAATRLRDGREGGNPAPRMVEWTQPTRAAPDGGPARTGRRRASPRGPRERDLAKGRA